MGAVEFISPAGPKRKLCQVAEVCADVAPDGTKSAGSARAERPKSLWNGWLRG